MKNQNTTQEVFAKAYEQYQKDLRVHAYFKVSDREVVEDLVQDTFMKTWKYLERGGKIVTMKAFLYRVLNNLIVDEYRKHKASSLDVLMEAGYEPETDDHEHLVDSIDGKTAAAYIDGLVEKYKKVLRMRFVEHLSLAEMSARTGQTKNTIAVQVHRGLEKLRSAYTEPFVTA